MKKVGIIMGSKSDLPIMQKAIDILKGFEIETDIKIVSAHRTPEFMFEYAKKPKKMEFTPLLQVQEVQHIYQEWLLP